MIAALALLSLLAPWAVIASDMPRPTAWGLAVASCTFGLHRLRAYARSRHCRIVLDPHGLARVDGCVAHAVALQWRGPIAFLRWRDMHGARQQCSFWPDTLDPALRRELRLAAGALQDAAVPGPVSH